MMTEKFNHAEAFCLMTYRCKRCWNSEQIWNSRDGVTPFITTCKIEGCGGESSHVNWEYDRRVVNYELQPGDRFFRDGTEEEARRALYHRIQQMGPDLMLPLDMSATEYIDEVYKSSQTREFRPGWPHLEMVPIEVPK